MDPRVTVGSIEERSPVESLTVYRALIVCHIAGAIFALLGLALSAGAIVPAFRTPTLIVALIQLVVATWLLFKPARVPVAILSAPRVTLVFSCVAAAFYLLPAVDPLGPPTVTVAFAWISTAAAVLPPKRWAIVGAAGTVMIAAIWFASGYVGSADPVVSGVVVLGALGFLPGAVNAAWMGATGSVLARRIRRWGLVIGHEDGQLSSLQADAQRVSDAAEELLDIAGQTLGPDATIAVGTLRHAAASATDDAVQVAEHLREVVAPMRPPFTISVHGDDDIALHAATVRLLDQAVLRHLTNVVIHAPGATRVDLTLGRLTDRGVALSIEDDGGGSPPTGEQEGEGSGISRGSLAAVGGDLRYERGAAGVRLVLVVPAPAAVDELPLPSLTAGLRSFIGRCLRNNRLATYLTPIPFLAFGTDGLLWSVPALLAGGCAIELAFRRAGDSGEPGDLRFLLLGAAIATAMTGLFAVALGADDPFVPSAATAYPIIELAWRGHWRWWVVGEVLRAALVAIWLQKAGLGGLGGAYVLPLALTLIAVGGRRLVMRAEQVEARVGNAVVRRRSAATIVQQAALRHDVVEQLAGRPLTPEARAALTRLDEATRRLAANTIPPVDPVDDVLTGIVATAAPAPVRIVDERAAQRPARALPTALDLDRRLTALEIGAVAGDLLVASTPPRWSGRPRLTEVRVDVETDGDDGGTRLRVRAVTGETGDGTAVVDAGELRALSTDRIAAAVDGAEVVLTVRAGAADPAVPGARATVA